MENREYELINDEKVIVLINGKKIECDVLFTYDEEDLGYTYMGYTDNSKNPDGSENVYFAKCGAFTNMKFVDVTDPEEINMLSEVYKEIINDVDKY